MHGLRLQFLHHLSPDITRNQCIRQHFHPHHREVINHLTKITRNNTHPHISNTTRALITTLHRWVRYNHRGSKQRSIDLPHLFPIRRFHHHLPHLSTEE